MILTLRECAHCSRPFNSGRHSRLMCWGCRQKPELRALYRSGSIYARKGHAADPCAEPPAPPTPTAAPPGSPAKVAVLEWRADSGVGLWHPMDASLEDLPLMTRFHDGPAKGQSLDLARSPLFLRVVHCERDGWDACDLLDDSPQPGEAVYAYRLVAGPTHGMLDYTDQKTGRRRGRPFAMAEYRLADPRPDEATMRDNEAWRAWCLARQQEATRAR